MILSTVVDFKYIILGTPFSENYTQNFHIQFFTMNFEHLLNDQLTIASFTTLIEENLPFFSFIHEINSNYPTYFRRNTVQTLKFLVNSTKTFLLKTDNHDPLFHECLKLIFCPN